MASKKSRRLHQNPPSPEDHDEGEEEHEDTEVVEEGENNATEEEEKTEVKEEDDSGSDTGSDQYTIKPIPRPVSGTSYTNSGWKWSKEDELAIVQGLIDFKRQENKDPFSNQQQFFEFVRGNLSNSDLKITQVKEKVRRLRDKYKKNLKNNAGGDQSKIFQLSHVVWGQGDDDGGKSGGGDDGNKKRKRKKKKNDDGGDGGGVAVNDGGGGGDGTIGVIGLPAVEGGDINVGKDRKRAKTVEKKPGFTENGDEDSREQKKNDKMIEKKSGFAEKGDEDSKEERKGDKIIEKKSGFTENGDEELSEGQTKGMIIERQYSSGDEEHDDLMVTEKGDDYVHLMNAFDDVVGTNVVPRVSLLSRLKKYLGSIDGSELEEWDKEWKEVHVTELEVVNKRLDLVRRHSRRLLDAMKLS